MYIAIALFILLILLGLVRNNNRMKLIGTIGLIVLMVIRLITGRRNS